MSPALSPRKRLTCANEWMNLELRVETYRGTPLFVGSPYKVFLKCYPTWSSVGGKIQCPGLQKRSLRDRVVYSEVS